MVYLVGARLMGVCLGRDESELALHMRHLGLLWRNLTMRLDLGVWIFYMQASGWGTRRQLACTCLALRGQHQALPFTLMLCEGDKRKVRQH